MVTEVMVIVPSANGAPKAIALLPSHESSAVTPLIKLPAQQTKKRGVKYYSEEKFSTKRNKVIGRSKSTNTNLNDRRTTDNFNQHS